ncbi:MAG: sulfotransferase domain-containing protein [Acidimicrobiales bacterium]|nr:sulfotransferase domain-containing protein [Acidimicrobiales bacterium]
MSVAASAPRDVLVLGCGRSGTSIFGELFESLPGYRYLSEPPVDVLRSSTGAPALATKVPHVPDAAAAQERVATMVGAMDDPIVIWVVRHPLDAIASLRVGIADGWGHHPRPTDWEQWLDRPLVERCAHHWATVNTVEWESARRHIRRVQRYEAMVTDPECTAREVAALVGTSPDEATERWWRRVRDRDDEHYVEARTSRRRSRPDHTVRVGRWRENLSPADISAVAPIVAEAAALHGYDVRSAG